MEWKIKILGSIDNMSLSIKSFYSKLFTVVQMSNMRGDDHYNLNQILINTINDFKKSIKDDRKKFWLKTEIKSDDQIVITNWLKEENPIVFELNRKLC